MKLLGKPAAEPVPKPWERAPPRPAIWRSANPVASNAPREAQKSPVRDNQLSTKLTDDAERPTSALFNEAMAAALAQHSEIWTASQEESLGAPAPATPPPQRPPNEATREGQTLHVNYFGLVSPGGEMGVLKYKSPLKPPPHAFALAAAPAQSHGGVYHLDQNSSSVHTESSGSSSSSSSVSGSIGSSSVFSRSFLASRAQPLYFELTPGASRGGTPKTPVRLPTPPSLSPNAASPLTVEVTSPILDATADVPNLAVLGAAGAPSEAAPDTAAAATATLDNEDAATVASPIFRVRVSSTRDSFSNDQNVDHAEYELEEDAMSLDPVLGEAESSTQQVPPEPKRPKSPSIPKSPIVARSPRTPVQSRLTALTPPVPASSVVVPILPVTRNELVTAAEDTATSSGEIAGAGVATIVAGADPDTLDLIASEVDGALNLGPSRGRSPSGRASSRGSLRPDSREHAEWARQLNEGLGEHNSGLHRDHDVAARALLVAREEAAAALNNSTNRPVSRHEVPGLHQWQYTRLRGAHFTPKPKTAASLEPLDYRVSLETPSATSSSSASAIATVSSTLDYYEHPVSYLPQQRVSGWRLSQGHSLQSNSVTDSEKAPPRSSSLASSSYSSQAPSSSVPVRAPVRASALESRAAAVNKHVQRQRAGMGKRALVWRGRDAHWRGLANVDEAFSAALEARVGAIEVESEVEASPGQNPAEKRAAAKWFQARSAPKPLALAQQQLDALDLIQQSIQQQQQQQQQPQDVSRQTSDSSKEWREPYLAHLSEKLGWSRDRNVHASGSASLSGQSSVSHDDENSSVDDSDLSSIPLGQPFDDAGLLTPEERALTDPAPREPSALPDSSCEANSDASAALTVVDVQNHLGVLADGSKVAMDMHCSLPCGNEYKHDTVFCRKCGRRRPVARSSH